MKNILTILGLCGVLLGVSSCDNYNDLIPEKYNKILSLKYYGEQELTLYKIGLPTEYTIIAMKSGNRPDLEASATVTVMSEGEFDQYLDDSGLNYKMLPSECYSISYNDLKFSSTDSWKVIPVLIDPDKTEKYIDQTSDSYVIPIVMTSMQDSVLLNQDKLILKPIKILTPAISFGNVVSGIISKDMKKEGGKITIPLNMQTTNQWDFSVKVEIVPSLTTIDGFTLANDGLVHFSKGENGTLELTIPELTNVKGTIGLKISSIEDMNIEFSDSPVTVAISIEKFPLTVNMLSTNAQEPTEGTLENLIDGSTDTYFQTAWSVSISDNHYLQVILPSDINSFVFDYTNRKSNGNAALNHFKVYAGATEETLELIKEYNASVDSLPLDGGGLFSSEELARNKRIRIIRFECVKNNSDSKHFGWSEFSLRAI